MFSLFSFGGKKTLWWPTRVIFVDLRPKDIQSAMNHVWNSNFELTIVQSLLKVFNDFTDIFCGFARFFQFDWEQSSQRTRKMRPSSAEVRAFMTKTRCSDELSPIDILSAIGPSVGLVLFFAFFLPFFIIFHIFPLLLSFSHPFSPSCLFSRLKIRLNWIEHRRIARYVYHQHVHQCIQLYNGCVCKQLSINRWTWWYNQFRIQCVCMAYLNTLASVW